MGAVCAIVYLLAVIVFIPFPFYKDIKAATSSEAQMELELRRQQVEMGRTLHKFPHSKVKGIHVLPSSIFRLKDGCRSWLRTSRSSYRSSPWSYLGLEMTYLTFDGATNSSFLLSPSSPYSSSTSWITGSQTWSFLCNLSRILET